MCAPAIIPIVSGIASVASTAFSIYQGIQEGEYQRDIADYNVRIAENEAKDTRNVATEKENIHRRKVASVATSQRASFGAKGVDINTGSAADLIEDTSLLGEVDALRIRETGSKQVDALGREASLIDAQGNQARSQGHVNAAGSALSGISRTTEMAVDNKWFDSGSSNTSNTWINPDTGMKWGN